jgi:hypothetical protein
MLDANVIGSRGRYQRRCARIEYIFDGSQDWVIVDNDAVAGSSPELLT